MEASAAPPTAQPAGDETVTERLVLRLADTLCTLPIAFVREISNPLAVCSVPGSRAWLLGLVDLRGQSVPLFDLAGMLGLRHVQGSANSRVVFLECETGNARHTLALAADEVLAVTELEGDVGSGKALGLSSRFIERVARFEGGQVVELDLPAVLETLISELPSEHAA